MIERYNRLEKTFSGSLLLLLAIGGSLQVLFRYVLSLQVNWLEELIILVSIWCFYIGSSVTTREDKHIRVAFLVDMLPKKPRFVLNILSLLLWLLCCVGIIYTGWLALIESYSRNITTLGGGYPLWLGRLAIPIGMLLMAIRVIKQLVDTVKNYNKGPDRISFEDTMKKEVAGELEDAGADIHIPQNEGEAES